MGSIHAATWPENNALRDRMMGRGSSSVDVEGDLARLDDGRPTDTRRMLGGRNGRCNFKIATAEPQRTGKVDS